MLFFNYLKSTIMSKIVMGVTGVILVLFIIGHSIGNLQVFVGKEALNNYAYFLQSLGEILWIIRIVLLLCLIFHIITSIRLKFLNLGAKSQKYRVRNYINAKLTARTMIWTGIMVFAFLAYHLLHFTIGVTNPKDYEHHDYYEKNASSFIKNPFESMQGNQKQMEDIIANNKYTIVKYEGESYLKNPHTKVLFVRHDVYYMVVKGFQNPLITILYIIGVILLGFHLNHAIQSAFQTLGFNHPSYTPKIIAGSTILSTIVVIFFISVPIACLLRIVGGSL
ncbi:MAG: succinate dehydrogenase cytochrome b subunit [FCB group bacterium]|jgi:succinate dehydrogenase / fumarate reductase cytochrome b subunit